MVRGAVPASVHGSEGQPQAPGACRARPLPARRTGSSLATPHTSGGLGRGPPPVLSPPCGPVSRICRGLPRRAGRVPERLLPRPVGTARGTALPPAWPLGPGPRGCRRRGGRAHRAACSRPPSPLPGRALPAVWSLSRWRPSVQTLARGWRLAHLRVLWLLGALGSGLGACPLTRGRKGLAAPASDAGPRHFRPLCPALP